VPSSTENFKQYMDKQINAIVLLCINYQMIFVLA
jgi:hypothetical protein